MIITIKVLNVGDGDSIIVHIEKEGSHLVILIDGGKPKYSDMIICELESILSICKKKAPDIIICSHFDFDHIGGLIGVIEHYKGNIGEIWIHKTSELFIDIEEPFIYKKTLFYLVKMIYS